MMKLGLRAPKRAPSIKLSRILTGVIPDHPPTADHFANVGDWGLYGNDQYGDCGPVSVANSRKLITKYLGSAEQSPTQNDVFDLYRRSGNPGFNPVTDADDNGVDMQTMLEAVVSGGIGGTKAVAFAEVDVSNLEEIKACLAIFGFGVQAVDLQTAQQAQSQNGLWDFSLSPAWGGHAVLNGFYSDLTGANPTLKVISWAQVIGETMTFIQKQLSQMFVVIWPEAFGTTQFINGIDVNALASDYQQLTGRTLVPPTPGPVPSSGPTIQQQIDNAFAALESRFANRPILLRIVKAVHAYVDLWMQNNPQFFGKLGTGAQLSPAALGSVLDQVFALVEGSLPVPYSTYVAMVQALMDALLSQMQAPRLARPDTYPVANAVEYTPTSAGAMSYSPKLD